MDIMVSRIELEMWLYFSSYGSGLGRELLDNPPIEYLFGSGNGLYGDLEIARGMKDVSNRQ